MTRQAAIIELGTGFTLFILGLLFGSSANVSIGLGYWFMAGFWGLRLCHNWIGRRVTFTGVHLPAMGISDLFFKHVFIQVIVLGLKVSVAIMIGVFGGGLWRFVQLMRSIV